MTIVPSIDSSSASSLSILSSIAVKSDCTISTSGTCIVSVVLIIGCSKVCTVGKPSICKPVLISPITISVSSISSIGSILMPSSTICIGDI